MEDKISEFLHVPSESLRGIKHSALKRLYKKIGEFERSEKEVTKLNVFVDEIKSQYYTRISKLTKLLNESSEEKVINSKVMNRLQDQLKEERSRHTRKIDALNKQLNASHETIKKLEDEEGAKEEASSWQDGLRNDDSTKHVLDKENKLLQRKLLEMENILQVCKSNAVSLQFKYDTASQEKELMLQNKRWTEERLSSCNQRALVDEVTKTSYLQNLEEKLNQTQTENESVSTYNKFLLDQNKKLSHLVEEKLLEIKNFKDTANTEKSEFSKEMTLQKKMNDLLRSQLTSFERGHSLRPKEKGDDKLCKNPEHIDVAEELVDAKLKLEKSKEECQLLKNIVSDCIEENGTTVNTNTAAPTVGKLFSNIKTLKRQLVKERSQKFQVQNQLKDFVLELEHKTPALVSFKERTELLEHELKCSTELLETISLAKRKDEKKLTSLEQKINSYEANIHSLVRQRLDLARQVKILLSNISAIQTTTSPFSNDELMSLRKLLESENTVNERDSQIIITEKLVEFKNIDELQEKNMELLNCIRILADKLETNEGEADKTVAKIENQTIKEAKDAIIEMESINSKLELRVNILTRERDSYKVLASANDNKTHADAGGITEATYEKKIRELQSKLSSTRVESSAIIQNLNGQLLTYKKSQTDGKIALQEFENFKVLVAEKEAMSQERINHLKTQLEKQRLSAAPVQDNKYSNLTDLSHSENKIGSLKYEISNIKKENTGLIAMKESLTRDLERCCKEKMQLHVKLSESETSQNEQNLIFGSKELQYSTRIKVLEKNLKELNVRLKSKEQEIKTLQSSKSSQLRWAQNTIDDTEKNLKSVSAELSKKETTIGRLSLEIENLGNELRMTKLQYKFLSNTSDTNTLEPTLRKELKQTQIELKDAHSQIKAYEEIISTNENVLKELNGELKKAKEDCETKIQLENKEKGAKEEELSHLRKELDEIRSLQPKLREGASYLVLQSEKVGDQAQRIQEMKNKIDKMAAIIEAYQKEESSQYQSELKTNKDLSEWVMRLEKEAFDYQTELKKTKKSLYSTQELLDRHEKKWMEEKADYERELISNIEQTESLRVENSVLIEKIDGATEGSNSNEKYLELVSLFSNLRQERSSLETKLTTCKRDLALLRQKNASLEKSIGDLQRANTVPRNKVQCPAVIIDEYEKIIKEIAQVNILRENNAILHKSLKNVTEKNEAIYKELTNMQEEISRLQGHLIQTKEQVSINANKVLAYESEIEQCKQRYQDLSQQQKLTHKNETEKLHNVIGELEVKLLNVQNANADLENKFNRLKKQAHEKLDASKKQQTALTNELNELKETKDKLEENLHNEESKVVDLELKLKEHGFQVGEVSKDHDSIAFKPFVEEIESLKKELQVFRNANDASDAFEKIKNNMEEEKNKIINEKTKDFEKKLEDAVNKSKSNESEVENSEHIEALKKEWLKEYEEETVKRIKEAEENLKKRIRLPSEERIQKIISKRKGELEQEFERKLKENNKSLVFSGSNEEEAEDELWNSPSKGSSEKPSVVTDLIKQKNIKLQEQLKDVKNAVTFNDKRPKSENKENNIPDSPAADNRVPSAFSFGKPLFSSNTSSFQSFHNPFTPSAANFSTGGSLPTFNIKSAFAAGTAGNTLKTSDPANVGINEAKVMEIGNTSKRPIQSDTSSDPDSKKFKESPENDLAPKD